MSDAYEIGFSYRNQRFTSASEGLRHFADALKSDFERVGPVLRDQLELYLQGVSSRMLQAHSGAWPGGTGPNSLSSRSGAALRSIEESIKVSGETIDSVEGRIGGIHYLKTQEYGATIVPVNAQYLTVPLPAALDSAGVPLKRSAREWENTFCARSKNGNLIIFQKLAAKEIVPLYLLVKEVVIPPRLGMRDTLESGKSYFVDQSMAAMLREMRKA